MSATTGETIGSALDRAGGRPSGFDYLRIGLAVAVLAWHSFRISDAMTDYNGWWGPIVRLILPMFFALSGFLVAASLMRVLSIHHFLILRTMRIMPALAVQLVFSAVIIGGALTTLPLGEYLQHPQFWRYFLNIFGIIQWKLPGVFETNPVTVVNASLWTIPYEIKAYLLLVGLWVIGAVSRPKLLIPLMLVGQFAIPFIEDFSGTSRETYGPLSGYVLIVAFCFGTAIYIARERVPMRGSWAIASLALVLALLSTKTGGYFAGPPAAYLTVWLGLRNPKRIAAIANADISYGIYLYAYPIQQAVVALLPEHRDWWVITPVALFFTTIMAVLSWLYIEKPALRQRKAIIAAVDGITDRVMRVFRSA